VSGHARPSTAGRPRANRHAVSGDNLPRNCAMTSRTNRRSGCRNQGDTSEARPSDLEQRRQLAVQRYLDGAPIEVICQEMGCSKSWLYKWRDRYQAGDPTWAQEVSRRPTTSPAKLSATLEEKIVHLLQTAVSTGAGPASAAAIRQALKDTGVEHIPSRRTIYRVLQRHEKEVTHPLSMP
jgi:transposase-like protein